MNRYIRARDGQFYDLEDKGVSSIEIHTKDEEYYDTDFIEIYYYDEDRGSYLERDGKGGHSCDQIVLNDIIKESNNILDLIQFDDLIEVQYISGNNIVYMDRADDIEWIQQDITLARVNKIYTKYKCDYLLAWDKKDGVRIR